MEQTFADEQQLTYRLETYERDYKLFPGPGATLSERLDDLVDTVLDDKRGERLKELKKQVQDLSRENWELKKRLATYDPSTEKAITDIEKVIDRWSSQRLSLALHIMDKK